MGNVGIGGIDPLYEFTVAGSTTMSQLLNVNAQIIADDLYIRGDAGIGGSSNGSSKLYVNGLMKSTSIHTGEFQLGWGNAFLSIRNSLDPTLKTFRGLQLIINPVGLNRVGIAVTNPTERLRFILYQCSAGILTKSDEK